MSALPKAFLIHGFVGAGKTTFAKRLAEEHGALRFTQDEWMSRLYGVDPPAEDYAEYARRISILMEDMWTQALDRGMNIVLDFGFWSRSERDQTRRIIVSRGGEPILYRLNCTEQIAWERVVKRNERLNGSLYIAPNTFEVLKSRFEPLADDEVRTEINSFPGSCR